MVPPLDHFQGKNKSHSSLAKMISTSRRSFFTNLTTFERRSGLKFFSLLKITILKIGWLSKFQSLRSWGDAHLRLINFDNHPIFKIHKLLLPSHSHVSKLFRFVFWLLTTYSHVPIGNLLVRVLFHEQQPHIWTSSSHIYVSSWE